MPFDHPHPGVKQARDRRSVALWLLTMCGMILVMVALGGATRLTGSGLSIMEWAPLRGTLPPLSDAEWQRLFELYRQIPQYELVNKGFGLEGFKEIFWLEWLHRLWGRLIGLAFVVPMAVFWWRGAIERRLMPWLLGLLVLGGLQGAIGWFMVASGFMADATAVSPYRLVVHLGLALLLYAAILWIALGLLGPPSSQRRERNPERLYWLVRGVALSVALTILAGGFVAGLKAGLTYNSFPLMDGRLVPQGYAQLTPFLLNWTENVAAVQFNHRLLASLTAVLAAAALLAGWRSAARKALMALFGAVGVQYALGVATLLYVLPLGRIPIWLGTAHQTMAVLVLTASLVALFQLRGR